MFQIKNRQTKAEVKKVGLSQGYIYLDNLQFIYGNDSADTDNPMVTSVKGGAGSLEGILLHKIVP